MVGLGAMWQTPPAFEQNIPDQNRGLRRDVTGETQNETKGGFRQADEVESSTLMVSGNTTPGAKVAVGEKDVTALVSTLVRGKAHTAAFSEYLFKRKTVELISLLNDLKSNLQQIEGAGIMVAFRRSLEEIWHVAGQLPKEKIVVVSAVEEAVRSTKWRELSIGQVEVLQGILSRVITSEELSNQDVSKAFRAINRSRIDVFPSALADEEEDDEIAADDDS